MIIIMITITITVTNTNNNNDNSGSLWCTMVKHSVHMSSCVCSQKMVARMLWHWLHLGRPAMPIPSVRQWPGRGEP